MADDGITLSELVDAWSVSGDVELLDEIALLLTDDVRTNATMYRGYTTTSGAAFPRESSCMPGDVVRMTRPYSWTPNIHTAAMFATINEDDQKPVMLILEPGATMTNVARFSSRRNEEEYLSNIGRTYRINSVEDREIDGTMMRVYRLKEIG